MAQHADPVAAPDPAPAHAAAPAPHLRTAVISVRTLVMAALIVLGVVALVVLLSRVMGIVLVVLMAIVFAEGIRPLVLLLVRRRVPLALAIVLVYLGLLAFLTGLIALLVQPIVTEAQSLAHNFPTYQRNFLQLFGNIEHQLHVNVDVTKQVGGALGAAQQILFTIGGYILGIVVDFVLVLVLGFLWLVSSERLKRFVVDLLPHHHQPLATDVFREIGYRMGGYLRAVAINSVAVGLATGIACTLLHLPSPILLGIFAGLMAAVPLIGPFLGVIPPTLLAFTIAPAYPALVLAVLLVIQLIDANTVVPLVMNRVVAMPALAVVLALLIGGALQGLIGSLLAVPVGAALQVLVVRVVVPAIHNAEGRPDPAFSGAAATAEPSPRRLPAAAQRLVPRLRRQ